MTLEEKKRAACERNKRYRQRHPERVRTAIKASQAKHPETKRNWERRYNADHTKEILEKSRRYEKKHLESRRKRSRERQKQWRKDHAEEARERDRLAWEKNTHKRQRALERMRLWRRNNPEEAKRRDKERREKNPETARAGSVNRKARVKNAPGHHTGKDIKRIYEDQQHRCAAPHCRTDISGRRYHVDHVLPLKLGGSNWPDNIQLLCPKCNLSKQAKHPEDWLREHQG